MVLLLLQIAVSATFLQGILARPQSDDGSTSARQYQQSGASSTTPVPIISQTEIVNGDGSFNFSYETGNGIKFQEEGYVKPNAQAKTGQAGAQEATEEENFPIQVLTGSFSYTAPDGQIISLSYIADENGFQPQGAHLPTAPSPPAYVQSRSIQGEEDQKEEEERASLQNPDAESSGLIPDIEIIRP